MDPAQALVVASHTFSAPHIHPPGQAPEGEEVRIDGTDGVNAPRLPCW
ncbi:hypothetical protein [Streptomyces prunicolor]|uniref:Uncharacterized protein n=1 Tax=Streptomyces prunicolor TaxID=67348 RepID=A0ABU4F5F5_9ACTN|nr:hypothetical protein [Streptomyces prunicolor]MDV7215815.1 hypothetical protein [Streptomyces prunicolor]